VAPYWCGTRTNRTVSANGGRVEILGFVSRETHLGVPFRRHSPFGSSVAKRFSSFSFTVVSAGYELRHPNRKRFRRAPSVVRVSDLGRVRKSRLADAYRRRSLTTEVGIPSNVLIKTETASPRGFVRRIIFEVYSAGTIVSVPKRRPARVRRLARFDRRDIFAVPVACTGRESPKIRSLERETNMSFIKFTITVCNVPYVTAASSRTKACTYIYIRIHCVSCRKPRISRKVRWTCRGYVIK